MSRFVSWLGLLLGAVTVSCDASRDELTAPGIAVVDSAGIEIVTTTAPLWSAEGVEPWTVSLEPAFEVPGGASEHPPLYRIGHVIRLDDGRVIVQNEGSQQLIVYDSLGNIQRSLGRAGEGPGEFDGLLRFFRCDANHLIVQDLSRAHFFHPDSGFVQTVSVQGRILRGWPDVVAASQDCTALLVAFEQYTPPLAGTVGVVRYPTTLFWMNVFTGARDTVGVFPGAERLAITTLDGRRSAAGFAFSIAPQWASDGLRVYYGPADAMEVQLLDLDDRLVRLIRWKGDRIAITTEDWATVFEKNEAATRANPTLRPYRPTGDRHPQPELAPSYTALLVDAEGFLWVQQFLRPPTESSELVSKWWVIDPSGRWLGEVVAPAGLEIKHIGGGYMTGVRLDTFDREHVVVFRIHNWTGLGEMAP